MKRSCQKTEEKLKLLLIFKKGDFNEVWGCFLKQQHTKITSLWPLPHPVEYSVWEFNLISYSQNNIACWADFCSGSKSRINIHLFVFWPIYLTGLGVLCLCWTIETLHGHSAPLRKKKIEFWIWSLLATGNPVQCVSHYFGSLTRICFTTLVLSRATLAWLAMLVGIPKARGLFSFLCCTWRMGQSSELF